MCAISHRFSENNEELYLLVLFLFSYLHSDK